MTTSEPTTGEIVQWLRKGGCFYGLSKLAADRLESQEREIHVLGDVIERCNERLISQDVNYGAQICALTARAEQAEKERDAAVKDVEWAMHEAGLCNLCLNRRGDDCAVLDVKEFCEPKWRGCKNEQ